MTCRLLASTSPPVTLRYNACTSTLSGIDALVGDLGAALVVLVFELVPAALAPLLPAVRCPPCLVLDVVVEVLVALAFVLVVVLVEVVVVFLLVGD